MNSQTQTPPWFSERRQRERWCHLRGMLCSLTSDDFPSQQKRPVHRQQQHFDPLQFPTVPLATFNLEKTSRLPPWKALDQRLHQGWLPVYWQLWWKILLLRGWSLHQVLLQASTSASMGYRQQRAQSPGSGLMQVNCRRQARVPVFLQLNQRRSMTARLTMGFPTILMTGTVRRSSFIPARSSRCRKRPRASRRQKLRHPLVKRTWRPTRKRQPKRLWALVRAPLSALTFFLMRSWPQSWRRAATRQSAVCGSQKRRTIPCSSTGGSVWN